MEELSDLVSALTLAGDEGRGEELAVVLLAQMLLSLAFMVFLIYPALARLR